MLPVLGRSLCAMTLCLVITSPSVGQNTFEQNRVAAERGDAAGQVNLGVAYATGQGVARDDGKAAEWFRKAADQGHARGQHNLALLYSTGRGVPRDDALALSWFRKAAEQGYASAQFNIGLRLAAGEGIGQDETQAAEWFRKAALQGHAASQNNLGLAYFDGRGVPKDEAEAVAWFRKGSEQQQPDAMNNLALAYIEGRGVAKDAAQGVAWFRKAAELGNVNSQFSLGDIYDKGDGVPRDDAQAAMWYRKAADEGHVRAQLGLARLYGSGRGVGRDEAEATEWLRKVFEFRLRPIKSWVGARFVFMPADMKSARKDYQPFYLPETEQKIAPLPHDAYVGKTVRVTKVSPHWVGGDDFVVDMIVEGTNERLRTLVMWGTFAPRLAPAADIERARSLLLGETLWRDAGSLLRITPATGEREFFEVSPFDALKVVAVKVGSEGGAPVQVVVRTPAGAEGFVDVNFSGTNLTDGQRDYNRFHQEFQVWEPRRESAAEVARSFEPSADALALAARRKDMLGWDQTWWGMKTNELVQVYGARLQKQPKRHLYNRMYVEYVLAEVAVNGKPYTVSFQMSTRTNRLAQVLVQALTHAKDTPDPTIYERLVEMFAKQHGPGGEGREDSASKTSITRDHQWSFPTTTLEVKYSFWQGSSLNGVTMTYYPTGSR